MKELRSNSPSKGYITTTYNNFISEQPNPIKTKKFSLRKSSKYLSLESEVFQYNISNDWTSIKLRSSDTCRVM